MAPDAIRMIPIVHLAYWVSGIGYWVSGIGYRVTGIGLKNAKKKPAGESGLKSISFWWE
jgi:hypothetical protein